MDDLIKHMVDRFLTWRLPDDFSPDAGISFKAEFNENTAQPMKQEPVGTNLLDATQAEAMVRHMLTPPPGYALVKLEGAVERVATALYAIEYIRDKEERSTFEDYWKIMVPKAQAAIKALTEGERS